jgi:hypothetical protein
MLAFHGAMFAPPTKTLSKSCQSRAALLAVACLPWLFVSGCSRDSVREAKPKNGQTSAASVAVPSGTIDLLHQPGTKFDVVYGENTVAVDQATVTQNIEGVTDDEAVLVFRNTPELRETLVAGKIALLGGYTIRKIVVAEVDGDHLILGTESATLTEVFKDANIELNLPVNVAQAGRQQSVSAYEHKAISPLVASLENFWSPQTVYAASAGADQNGGTTNGWKWTSNIQSQSDQLDFDVNLDRNTDEFVGNIRGKGSLSNFSSTLKLVINNHSLDSASFTNSEMKGDLQLDWAAGTKKPTRAEVEIGQFKLPATVTIPFQAGMLPMNLAISEAIFIKPMFSGNSESAHGSFNIHFDGPSGLSFANGGTQQLGQANGDAAIQDNDIISPLAPFGIVIAVAMPRVELSAGTTVALSRLTKGMPANLLDLSKAVLNKSSLASKIVSQLDKVISKTEKSVASDAAFYVQLVASTTGRGSGLASMIHCRKFTLETKLNVGMNLTVLGQDMSKVGSHKPKMSFDAWAKDLDFLIPPNSICND